jgi:hypothetical protein
LPYFKRSERLDDGGSDAHHGRTGELRLSWVKDLHGTSEAFLKAAKQAGGYHGRSGQTGDCRKPARYRREYENSAGLIMTCNANER